MVNDMDRNILEGKRILVVDNEPDVLDTVEGGLASSQVITVKSFTEARLLIAKESFDLVMLDTNGVNGFFLLEACSKNKVPAAVLTAHPMNAKILNAAIRMGAVSLIPKEALHQLPEIVAEIFEALELARTHGARFFQLFGPIFKERPADL